MPSWTTGGGAWGTATGSPTLPSASVWAGSISAMPRWTGRRVTSISRGRLRSSRSASRSPIPSRRNDGRAYRAPFRIQSARQRAMQEMLANPAVQGGLAPFAAALIVAALLAPFRLGGLAVVAAFATAPYFIPAFPFKPLTATRKIILLGLPSPVAAIVIDFAFRPPAPPPSS